MSIGRLSGPFVIAPAGGAETVGRPAVATLADGRFVVVWAEVTGDPAAGTTDTDGGIFARIYAADGTEASSLIQVNAYTPFAQYAPQVVALADGGFAVSWISVAAWGAAPAETDAFLAFFDAAGTRRDLPDPFDQLDLLPDNPVPEATDDADGSFVVDLGRGDAFAVVLVGSAVRTYDSAGDSAGAVLGEAVPGSEPGGFPFGRVDSVHGLSDGGIAVAGLDTSGRPLLWLADLTLAGPPPSVPGLVGPVGFLLDLRASVAAVRVAAFPDGAGSVQDGLPGGLAVAAASVLPGGTVGITLYTLTAAGAVTGRQTIDTGLAPGAVAPGGFDLAALPDGTLALAWTGADADGTGIFLGRFDGDATALGRPVVVHAAAQAGDQRAPDLTVLADGSVMVAFLDASGVPVEGAAGPIRGVIAQIGSPGALQPSAESDLLTGTAAADAIRALAGDDTVSGAGGQDRLWGDAGSDLLRGATGNDMLFGGTAGDRLEGGTGADALNGGAGDDRLFGGDGNDDLEGGSGADALSGGAGRDRLEGGSGADTLTGGAGEDLFVFRLRSGADSVTDFADGDRIVLDRALWAGEGLTRAEVLAEFAQVVRGTAVLDFGGGDVLTLVGSGPLAAADLILL